MSPLLKFGPPQTYRRIYEEGFGEQANVSRYSSMYFCDPAHVYSFVKIYEHRITRKLNALILDQSLSYLFHERVTT